MSDSKLVSIKAYNLIGHLLLYRISCGCAHTMSWGSQGQVTIGTNAEARTYQCMEAHWSGWIWRLMNWYWDGQHSTLTELLSMLKPSRRWLWICKALGIPLTTGQSHNCWLHEAMYIRKSGEIRFSNIMFMNLSQYYNAQTTGYNCVSATCRIIVASSIRYNIISAMQSKYNMATDL